MILHTCWRKAETATVVIKMKSRAAWGGCARFFIAESAEPIYLYVGADDFRSLWKFRPFPTFQCKKLPLGGVIHQEAGISR